MASVMDRAEQMFPRLTQAQIDRIASVGKRREVEAGEVLFELGDQNTRFFVVLSGAIEIVRPLGTLEEPVTVHRQGQFSTQCGIFSTRGAVGLCNLAGLAR
jgi:thioredoxin reductase (NADPH)